jgi:peptidoglycan/xylan/chitin deacetylase (PgdA/CDA1 family)
VIGAAAAVLTHIAPFPGRREERGHARAALLSRASPGDIVVIHDGDDDHPRADRRYAVETVERLIPALKARGFQFGTVCPQ